MKVQQIWLDDSNEMKVIASTDEFNNDDANLVLAFGERTLLEKHAYYEALRKIYPTSEIVICSTSGQISNEHVVQNQLVANAISFEKSKIKFFLQRYYFLFEPSCFRIQLRVDNRRTFPLK